jgi:hypothetical protein
MKTNVAKLMKELEAAGIKTGGCNSSGIVWDADGVTEIQDLPEVQAVLKAHDPSPDAQPASIEERLEVAELIISMLMEV